MPSPSPQPSFLRRLAAGLKLPVPAGGSVKLPPVNRVVPPFGQTQSANRQGVAFSTLEHPTSHQVIQHPNLLHGSRDGASPFIESAGAANGIRGRAKHQPPFSGAGTLSRPNRK